jgi:hypothetical protein
MFIQRRLSVFFRVTIYDQGKWTVRAEGQEAERLIAGLDAITLLGLLAEGKPLHLIDFRAVLEPDGEIVCLRATEVKAAEIASREVGRRVALARTETASVADAVILAHPDPR